MDSRYVETLFYSPVLSLFLSQDPLNQYPGFITYAASNPYHPLVNQSVINQAITAWSTPNTGCQSQVRETTSCHS